MINVADVGAFPAITASGLEIRFGLYLPGIRAADGFDVVVRVIHAADRFDPAILPHDTSLTWNAGHPLDLWSAAVAVPPIAVRTLAPKASISIASSSGGPHPAGRANSSPAGSPTRSRDRPMSASSPRWC